MKIPKATQLDSGNWNIRVTINKKVYSITKSTRAECEKEAAAIKAGAKKPADSDCTLAEAIEDYIASRENVLSPATIRGYRIIQRNRFRRLQMDKILSISGASWQRAVNAEAKKVSPKTLKNSAAFIQSVYEEKTGEKLKARIPQVVPHELPWLNPDELKIFLSAIVGNRYEIPMLLAVSGLRHSEIVSVQRKDIDLSAGTITVHGAAVRNDSGELIRKESNKNGSSRRTVPFIIPRLAELVEQGGYAPEDYLYPAHTVTLRNAINRVCESNGLPSVGVHGLRRSFASLCYHLGIPDEITMIAGGWSNPSTLRKIYTKIPQKDIEKHGKIIENFMEMK